MKPIIAFICALCLLSLVACSQNAPENKIGPEQAVGDGCEGCEAVYETPIPFEKLSWIDTLPDFNEAGPRITIGGVIYEADGKTPAKNVVLFIYHTDQQGNYLNKYKEKGWAKRQGYIRGWMKTNEKGEYRFYTLKPASYPNSNALKHIHPTIKEPGKKEYWIDEFIFDDDPYLTPEMIKQNPHRGGDGLISLKDENGILSGVRNIYLGKNIPNYPSINK